MATNEARSAEKGLSSNVHATSDRRDAAMHVEEELINSPPDGGYGWTIVVAILFLNAVTWGMTFQSTTRNPTDLRKVLTRPSESTYRTSRHTRPSQTLLRLCTRLSGVFRSLSLCYVLPWRMF